MNEFLGQDWLCGESGDLATRNGDAAMATPRQTVIQDVMDRISTPVGSVFYDKDYGCDLWKYRHKGITALKRLELLGDVEQALSEEPRLDPRYTTVTIDSWDLNEIRFTASMRVVGTDNDEIITLTVGDEITAAIQDFNPVY